MLLVDPRILQSKPTPSVTSSTSPLVQITQPETKVIDLTLTGLDRGLQEILNRQDIPPDEKVKLYSNYLQQYLTLRERQTELYRTPASVSLTKEEPPTEAVPADTVESEVLRSVPKTMQKQATLLLERIKQDPEMQWTPRGELVIRQQTIPQSNMVDLINDLLRKRKNFNPVGWQELAQKLEEGNVPQDLIRNQDRLAFMKASDSEGAVGLSPQAVEAAIRAMEHEKEKKARKAKRPTTRSRKPSFSPDPFVPRGRRRRRSPSSILSSSEWVHF